MADPLGTESTIALNRAPMVPLIETLIKALDKKRQDMYIKAIEERDALPEDKRGPIPPIPEPITIEDVQNHYNNLCKQYMLLYT